MNKLNITKLGLTIAATGGVVLTAVLTAKATPKANDILEKHKKDKLIDKAKAVTPTYLPAIISGSVTIGCIFGIGTLNKKQLASLGLAYGTIAKQYQDYKNKVVEKCGKETHDDILKDLAVEHVNPDHTIYTTGIISSSSLDFGTEEEERLFYECYSQRYFTSTVSKVIQAQYHLNRNFMLGGEVSLNDFFEFLGIEKTEYGDKVGWTINDDCYWIDFYNHMSTIHGEDDSDDEFEVCLIDYQFEPTESFLDIA